MRAMDTTKSLLACGVATALALSQSNDEQQPACVVERVSAISAVAECHEKEAAPLHIERAHDTGLAWPVHAIQPIMASAGQFAEGYEPFLETPRPYVEKHPAPLHIEPDHVGPHPNNALPGYMIPGPAFPGTRYYGPEPAA
jgi:hypothetical protein